MPGCPAPSGRIIGCCLDVGFPGWMAGATHNEQHLRHRSMWSPRRLGKRQLHSNRSSHEHVSIRWLSLRIGSLSSAWRALSNACVPLQGMPAHDGHDQLCRVHVSDGCRVAQRECPVDVRTSIGEQLQNRLHAFLRQLRVDRIADIRAVATIPSHIPWLLRRAKLGRHHVAHLDGICPVRGGLAGKYRLLPAGSRSA